MPDATPASARPAGPAQVGSSQIGVGPASTTSAATAATRPGSDSLTDARPRSTPRAKRFQQRNLLTRDDVSALFPEEPAAPAVDAGERIVDLPIADLWLDDQPRQLVPDAILTRLIASGEARPAALLAELRTIARQHTYYAGVLASLETLAQTIAAEGVLEPLLAVRLAAPSAPSESEPPDAPTATPSANPAIGPATGQSAATRLVLRDGHRRTLASLIAGRETVPVRIIPEPTDVQAAARQLIVNIQREDLTALEKGRWLYRLARLIEAQLRGELTARGESAPGESVIESLVSNGPAAEDGAEPEETRRGATAAERDLAARIRERVRELTGLSQRHYYNLMYLNRLSPAAREAGVALSEGQLRPVTSLPARDQPEIVAFIAARQLTSKEATTLVQVARAGDRDAVRRVMAKLAREDVGRQRAAVTWEPLMHALPKDLWARCAALRAELAALPEDLRHVRLRSMWDQRRLAIELTRQFDEIFTLHGFFGNDGADGSDGSEEIGDVGGSEPSEPAR